MAGEFPPDCLVYKNNSLTQGPVSFVPPFGFDSNTIKDAKFIGNQPCGDKKCDIFEFDASKFVPGKKVTFSFAGKILVAIEEKNSDGKERKATFDNFKFIHLTDDLFEPPKGVTCRPGSFATRRR